MEPDLVKLLEYLKNALPRLNFIESTQLWFLEFDAHYGEMFECETLAQLAEQLEDWVNGLSG